MNCCEWWKQHFNIDLRDDNELRDLILYGREFHRVELENDGMNDWRAVVDQTTETEMFLGQKCLDDLTG